MCDCKFTAENCDTLPWKCNGERILRLCSILRSEWHVIVTDNYYTNVPLALELLRKGHYLIGMMRKDRVPCQELKTHFGTAKKPKPTRQHPKGTWVSASDTHERLTIHGFMDSSVCYLCDAVYGNQERGRANIRRKNKQGTYDIVEGPTALNIYNANMGGVDAWDQLRTGMHYSMEQVGRSNKWTVSLFLGLFSMAICNSYLIYRAVNPDGCDTFKTHTEFHTALLKGLFRNTYGVVKPKSNHPTPGSGTFSEYLLHEMGLAKPGSRKDGTSRAKSGICHGCTGNSKTSYACKTCLIPMHPECHVKFHKNMTVPHKTPNTDWAEAMGLDL